MTSVSLFLISNNSATSRYVDFLGDQNYSILSCPAVVFASQLRELCRD